MLSTSSVFAQAFQFSQGSYYSQQGSIQRQCGYAYWNFGQCVVDCKVAVWNSWTGTAWGYVRVWNGYNYFWDYRQVYRTWWSYNWQWQRFFSNRCF